MQYVPGITAVAINCLFIVIGWTTIMIGWSVGVIDSSENRDLWSEQCFSEQGRFLNQIVQMYWKMNSCLGRHLQTNLDSDWLGVLSAGRSNLRSCCIWY